MKRLLAMTAAIECPTGIALAVAPAPVVRVLLGSTLDSPAGLVLGRILGAALFSVGLSCWLARKDAPDPAAAGLVAAVMLYNLAAVLLLGHAWIGLGMSGTALVPAVILHSFMGVWCVATLGAAHWSRSKVLSPPGADDQTG